MSISWTRPVAVILDFFGTLVDVDRDAPTMADVLVSMGYDCPDALELVWNTRGFDGARTPTLDDDAYAEWRELNLHHLASAAGVAADERNRVVALLLENDRSWTVRAQPGATELLGTLDDAHLAYVICSNWDYDLTPYLEQAGIDPNVPAVTSAAIGYRKPAQELFEAALDVVGATCLIRCGWLVTPGLQTSLAQCGLDYFPYSYRVCLVPFLGMSHKSSLCTN